MRPDENDPRRSRRLAGGVIGSLLLHALAAALLFALAVAPAHFAAETLGGTEIVSVTRQMPIRRRPRAVPRAPRSLHELAAYAPTAPPQPTPAPLPVTPVPARKPLVARTVALAAPAATSLPTAAVVAAIVRPAVAPTRAPTPQPRRTVRPSPAPTVAPTAAPTTAPTAAAKPSAAPSALPSAAPAPTQGPPAVPVPGPKPQRSPGAAVSSARAGPAARAPIQSPATPRPAAGRKPGTRAAGSLNARLRSLIPSEPAVVATPKGYRGTGLMATPRPEPTPPASVLAATKFLFVENVAGQRWKGWPLGSAPEERYAKMYVTSITRLGPISWCHGWVVRAPLMGSSRWIVESDASFICAGRLQPFVPPGGSPSPQASP